MHDLTYEDDLARVLELRRSATRKALLCAVVFGGAALALVAYLLISSSQRHYLLQGAPAHSATVVGDQLSDHDSCRGRIAHSRDIRLRWNDGGAARTGTVQRCADHGLEVGTHTQVWVLDDGVLTLDSPTKARTLMLLLVAFMLALGSLSTWVWLRQRPAVPPARGTPAG